MARSENMIGIATTTALPTMAPEGGADPILGIDPLAVAIPAGEEHSISYDAAFSGTAHGKIRVYEQKGLPLPEGWALDGDGVPTTDDITGLKNVVRTDQAQPEVLSQTDELLEAMPETKDRHLNAKKIYE